MIATFQLIFSLDRYNSEFHNIKIFACVSAVTNHLVIAPLNYHVQEFEGGAEGGKFVTLYEFLHVLSFIDLAVLIVVFSSELAMVQFTIYEPFLITETLV